MKQGKLNFTSSKRTASAVKGKKGDTIKLEPKPDTPTHDLAAGEVDIIPKPREEQEDAVKKLIPRNSSVSRKEPIKQESVSDQTWSERPELNTKDKKWRKLIVDAKAKRNGLPLAHGNKEDEISQVLRVFDLNYDYGPCIGVSRLERWERAHALGLNPPLEIRDILSTRQGVEVHSNNVFHGEVYRTRETDVDVLIIGAGPAGLFAANALARAGIDVKIIDKRPVKIAAGQADGIQPRTIEVLQSYGLAERLLKEGTQLHMAAFYNPSPKGGIELTERVPDTNAPTARYPFEVTLHQGSIESLFLDSMERHDVRVARPMYPLRSSSVVLKNLSPLEDEPDTEIVRAKFVIGADGAHSWVRKALGITMEGEQTDYIWGVVDLIPETNFPDIRNKSAIHSENGSCMIIPREGDGVRLYIQLSEKDGAVDLATGRVDKSRIGPRKILEVAQKTLAPYTIETPESFEWWTIYIIGQRVASKFSVNERIFIVGDACHTHSPKAGQGMNASMNDSHNLIWKMAHVLRGWADMSLLKTYELERKKYAHDLIDFDREFAKKFSDKPKTEGSEDGVTHDEFKKTFQKFGLFSTGIGVQYAPSQIVTPTNQSAAQGLPIGQRVLPTNCSSEQPTVDLLKFKISSLQIPGSKF
ncbi:hypothetical protein NP233_g10569 [Leucocoprinus birnbaumii]|uniref:FAD-binding domain-containing protein n=1 Tax=Leucocoprinus birnbaumii TaxID=56174 RepID=A0AAD5YRS5_9AGAR|nr:hypothetical protein NP233_g10569 [Leucocoprinus birnbaumii]